MKSYNLTMILFLLLCPGIITISAQSLTELENKYELINDKYQKAKNILDSLTNIFSLRTDEIDIEKKKTNPDKDKIVDLMARSTTLSNRIEEQNKKVKYLQKDIDNIKQQLNNYYASIIDSLELKKTKGNEDKDKLDAEILNYTEKKLLVAPYISILSFNPEKILEIDLDKTKDPKEKTLYKEYLTSALKEVNKLLGNAIELSSEIDLIVRLQKKTKKFLEEAELESGVIHRRQYSVAIADDKGRSFSGGPAADFETAGFEHQVNTYYLILNQLSFDKSIKTDLDWEISFQENDKLDLKEYQKLLKEVKKRLQEFKLVLANKTGFSK